MQSEKVVSAVLLLTGGMLCALPWLPVGARLGAPSVFDDTAPVCAAALATIDAVDAAFAKGDAALLRQWASSEYLSALGASLRCLGRRLEGGSGAAASGLGQELRARPFRGGRAGGNCVVLGFDLDDDEADAGYPMTHGLKLVVLTWNGQRLLLHAVQERVLPRGADRFAEFDRLAGSWLPAVP